MTIMVGFDNNEQIIIQDVCNMSRLIKLLGSQTDKNTKFIVIKDIVLNLDKITFIKEYVDNRPKFTMEDIDNK